VLYYVNSASGKPMISCNWRHVVMHVEMVERRLCSRISVHASV